MSLFAAQQEGSGSLDPDCKQLTSMQVPAAKTLADSCISSPSGASV